MLAQTGLPVKFFAGKKRLLIGSLKVFLRGSL